MDTRECRFRPAQSSVSHASTKPCTLLKFSMRFQRILLWAALERRGRARVTLLSQGCLRVAQRIFDVVCPSALANLPQSSRVGDVPIRLHQRLRRSVEGRPSAQQPTLSNARLLSKRQLRGTKFILVGSRSTIQFEDGKQAISPLRRLPV